jgi:hypothetical protein
MGLDIYLYRYDDYNKTQELEKKFQDFEKEAWEGNDKDGKYELLTEEQKEGYQKKCNDFASSIGLDKYGLDKTGTEKIEINSEKYPDHYFKIGYFRSSYNEGGIERILRNLGLPTMKDVFTHNEDEYNFQPNWEQALVNVKSLIGEFKKMGSYRVHHVEPNMFRTEAPKIKSEKEALDLFLGEVEKTNGQKEKYNYSNSDGEFSFAEPMKVLAMIPGTYRIFNDRECVYVVTESDNTWYINALEIVQDTIEYVLSKENKEQYYLHWSG